MGSEQLSVQQSLRAVIGKISLVHPVQGGMIAIDGLNELRSNVPKMLNSQSAKQSAQIFIKRHFCRRLERSISELNLSAHSQNFLWSEVMAIACCDQP
ncbi:MAG: hypothetical protein HC895_05765 [Leptolyngbyaceae cyanobacterium SM1_3_5]|nr:hypothetical protein [Leptolyngbyaceae cyanobacterium SM1_3_5]